MCYGVFTPDGTGFCSGCENTISLFFFKWHFREVQTMMRHVLLSNFIPVTHCVCFIFVHLQVVKLPLLKFIRLIISAQNS